MYYQLLIFSSCIFFLHAVSSPFHSPPLDSTTAYSQQNQNQSITAQQLLRRLFLTKKLLALKKLSLKNQAMAVNLETLLPQAFQDSTFPLVPSDNGTEGGSLFGDVFSPTSMYGSENLSFLDSESMTLDPSLFKDPALQFGDDGVQYLENGGPLYQSTPSSGTGSMHCMVRLCPVQVNSGASKYRTLLGSAILIA